MDKKLDFSLLKTLTNMAGVSRMQMKSAPTHWAI